MMRSALALLVATLLASPVGAHPLAPALLGVTEAGSNRYDVLWRSSAARMQQGDVRPVFPDGCREESAPSAMAEPGQSIAVRWTLRCDAPLTGQILRIEGLERSTINVIVRVANARGQVMEELLDPDRSSLMVPAFQAPPPVFASYLGLGVKHLLTGIDHLLFVLGLVLLVPSLRRLVLTVTAFTVGHSVTLSLAVLGVVHVNPGLTELAIAGTILVLGCELARAPHRAPSLLARRPWWMAGAFGLVHGLGFAGALAQTGFPAAEIPLSLLAFNLGIEAGQLLIVAATLALLAATTRLPAGPAPQQLARLLPAYLIGSLAAFWCIERGTQLLM